MALKASEETACKLYSKVDWSLYGFDKESRERFNQHLSEVTKDCRLSHAVIDRFYEIYNAVRKFTGERQEWIKKFLDAGHDFKTALQITSYPIAD